MAVARNAVATESGVVDFLPRNNVLAESIAFALVMLADSGALFAGMFSFATEHRRNVVEQFTSSGAHCFSAVC